MNDKSQSVILPNSWLGFAKYIDLKSVRISKQNRKTEERGVDALHYKLPRGKKDTIGNSIPTC